MLAKVEVAGGGLVEADHASGADARSGGRLTCETWDALGVGSGFDSCHLAQVWLRAKATLGEIREAAERAHHVNFSLRHSIGQILRRW